MLASDTEHATSAGGGVVEVEDLDAADAGALGDVGLDVDGADEGGREAAEARDGAVEERAAVLGRAASAGDAGEADGVDVRDGVEEGEEGAGGLAVALGADGGGGDADVALGRAGHDDEVLVGGEVERLDVAASVEADEGAGVDGVAVGVGGDDGDGGGGRRAEVAVELV